MGVATKCRMCNKEIILPPSWAKARKYCSRKCYDKWQSLNKVGENNHFYGKKHSVEARNKISCAQKGKVSLKKGKHYPHLQGRKRLDLVGRTPWNKGKKMNPISTKHREIIASRHKGKIVSLETRRKMRDSLKGNKSGGWIDGRTPLARLIYRSLEYKQWRKSVFEKDNWICQECFTKRKKLNPHHIKLFSVILTEFLKTYSQFSPIEDKETLSRLAITYGDFWDVENGITLCENCHKNKHRSVNECHSRSR